MMENIRKYLIYLRKQENKDNMKPAFAVRLVIIVLIGIIVGVLVDIFLPFMFFTNALRGIISLATGVSAASFVYLMEIKYKDKKMNEDRFYLPIRKRFSYRQRFNISVILGFIIVIFVLFVIKENFAYTLQSSIAIMLIFILIIFTRRYRDEFLKDIYEIPDTRDLEFMNKKKNVKPPKKKRKFFTIKKDK